MIAMNYLYTLFHVLPQFDLTFSTGDLLIIDLNAEIVGEINFNANCVTIYKEYSYAKKVVRRLKRASIPVELREQSVMEQAMKVLYEYQI